MLSNNTKYYLAWYSASVAWCCDEQSWGSQHVNYLFVLPQVTWFRGVRELTYTQRYRILAEKDGHFMMQIPSTMQQTDSGEFNIVASNPNGSVKFTTFINILPPRPDAPVIGTVIDWSVRDTFMCFCIIDTLLTCNLCRYVFWSLLKHVHMLLSLFFCIPINQSINQSVLSLVISDYYSLLCSLVGSFRSFSQTIFKYSNISSNNRLRFWFDILILIFTLLLYYIVLLL